MNPDEFRTLPEETQKTVITKARQGKLAFNPKNTRHLSELAMRIATRHAPVTEEFKKFSGMNRAERRELARYLKRGAHKKQRSTPDGKT